MKYFIKKSTLGCRNRIEISKEKYSEIKKAKECLFSVLNIEEKFDILLSNYREFEKELLIIALDYSMYNNLDWSSSKDEIHKIDKIIINLLSVCRLYLDSVPHNIKQIINDYSDFLREIKTEKSYQYDNYLGYRVLEALRNFVQHRGLPIHHFSYSGKKVENNDDNHLVEFVIEPSLRIIDLEKDNKFKKQILNELKDIGDKIDLRPLVREYIDSLGRIHNLIREKFKSDIEIWDSIIKDTINLYKEEFSENELGLCIVKLDDNDLKKESIIILDDMIKRREELIRKNSNITSFSNIKVSNDII